MEQIWWERVPHALQFMTDITNQLLGERSLILHSSVVIPWYDYMLGKVQESVRQHNGIYGSETLRDIDQEAGAYLLGRFCSKRKRDGYRPNRTYAQYLAEDDDLVLHTRYLWVRVTSGEQLADWANFATEYLTLRKGRGNAAVFILEWIGEKSAKAYKGISCYSMDEYITEYDRFAFCTLAASTVREPFYIREYLTALTSTVIGNDMELCALCLDDSKGFLEDPYGTICHIVETESRNNGDVFEYTMTERETQRAIWLAQIKTIYPVLEEYRERMLQQNWDRVSAQVPFTLPGYRTFKETGDVELGGLKYLADERKMPIPYEQYQRLYQYKKARDTLAHLKPMSIEEIRDLNP